ncbi:MAG: Lrp/AsnC family transcriptional regulator [Thermoplasmatales archaeon]|nr:MAG: Lrp/AsnC family transcriptional regulator [Thermoplasmatales archaeon]
MVNIENIDLKDRKILYHLDLNSRQSFSQIGKKVGLHKDTVAFKVKRFQKKGIIVRFNTIIDALKLGYTCMRFYINFQYITPEIKKEIIEHFVNFKLTQAVASPDGGIDLCVFMIAKNITEIHMFWQKTLSKYRDYFSNQIITPFIGENIYTKSFLIDEKDDRANLIVKRGGEVVDYDDLDFQILQLLAKNARIKTVDIAKELNSTSITISKRINRLIEKQVVLRFHITINWDVIGYKWFKVDLFLKDYNKIHQITKFLEANPYLAYIDKTFGYADLELELIVKNVDQLKQIIEDISNKFPTMIRSCKYFSVSKSYKWIDMPEK